MTVASSVAFLGARFLVSDQTVALYAVFGAIALGVLSDVTGSPRERTRLMLAALPVGLALVALGAHVSRCTLRVLKAIALLDPQKRD